MSAARCLLHDAPLSLLCRFYFADDTGGIIFFISTALLDARYIVCERVRECKAQHHAKDNLASQSHFQIARAEQQHAESLMTLSSISQGDVLCVCCVYI